MSVHLSLYEVTHERATYIYHRYSHDLRYSRNDLCRLLIPLKLLPNVIYGLPREGKKIKDSLSYTVEICKIKHNDRG